MRDLIHQKKEGLQTLEAFIRTQLSVVLRSCAPLRGLELHSLSLRPAFVSVFMCFSASLCFFSLFASPLSLSIPAPHSHTQGRHLNLKSMLPGIPGLQPILELSELSG